MKSYKRKIDCSLLWLEPQQYLHSELLYLSCSIDVNEVQPGKWALSIYSQLLNWIKMLPPISSVLYFNIQNVKLQDWMTAQF